MATVGSTRSRLRASPNPERNTDPVVVECLGGARACPPEDCGGVPGYENLQRVLADPADEEYRDMKEMGRPRLRSREVRSRQGEQETAHDRPTLREAGSISAAPVIGDVTTARPRSSVLDQP